MKNILTALILAFCLLMALTLSADIGTGVPPPEGKKNAFTLKIRSELPEPKVSVSRNWGYFIGDLFTVVYRDMVLPPGMFLDEENLPRENGEITEWTELKKKKLSVDEVCGIRTYDLSFTYQVFAKGSLEYIVIPPLKLRYGPKGKEDMYTFLTPAVPLLLSPVSNKNSQFAPLILTGFNDHFEIVFSIFGYVLVLLGIIYIFFTLKTMRASGSPFKSALQTIRHIPSEQMLFILNIFRESLDKKAKKAVFGRNLDMLFKELPEAIRFKPDIVFLIELSDNMSFGPDFRVNDIDSEKIKRITIRVLKELRRCELWA